MIWEASMTPRLVVVTPKPDEMWEAQRSSPGILLPAIFSVCKESRHCALRHHVWKFTIIVKSLSRTYSDAQRPRLMTMEHARVVMSPSDTLGFLGWKFQTCFGRTLRIDVESADETSPWEILSTRHSPQPEVKRIALLDHNLSAKHRIFSDLNSTPSWYLDSNLHNVGSTTSWVVDPYLQTSAFKAWSVIPHYPWDNPMDEPYSKHKISIRPHTFLGSLWEWGAFLWPGFRRHVYDDLTTQMEADIVSFEFIEKTEEGIGHDSENSQKP